MSVFRFHLQCFTLVFQPNTADDKKLPTLFPSWFTWDKTVFFYKCLVFSVNIERFCTVNMGHRMLDLCFRVWVTNSVFLRNTMKTCLLHQILQHGSSACSPTSAPFHYCVFFYFLSNIRLLSVVCRGTRLGYKHWSVVQLLILSNVFSKLTPLLPTQILMQVYYYYYYYYTSNKVSNIIKRHIDNRELLLICILLLSHSLIFFRFISYQYMVVFLFNTVIYVFLL